MLEMARTCSRRSVSPLSCQAPLQLVGTRRSGPRRVLALAGHDDDASEARGHRLLDHVLDDGLVHHGQHLLGLRLGGGQEARAESGGRKHGLADLLMRDHAAGCYHAPPGGREPACYPAAVMLDLRYVVENSEARPRHAREPRAEPRRACRPSPASPASTPGRSTASGGPSSRRSSSSATASASAGEEIARRGKAKEDASELKAEMKGVADEIKPGDARLEEVEAAIAGFLLVVPNVPDASVPVGHGRRGQRRGPPGRRAARASTSSPRRTGTSGPSSASSTSSARPRSRARASPCYWARGRGSSARSSSSCSTCTRVARLPRGHPALSGHRGDAHGHGPAPEVRGRPVQDARPGTATST